MKKFWIALLSLVMLTGCASSGGVTPAPSESQTSGNTAGQEEQAVQLTFTANDLDGNAVDQSVFANAKLTMMNVWATFCGPCLNEMPDLGELAAAGGADYQIIGVCSDLDGSDEMLAEAKDLVEQTGADYLHLQPSEGLLPVLTATSSVPVTFFFDSEGTLVGQGIVGAYDKETWAQEIENRLAMVEEDTDTVQEAQDDAAA